MGAIVPSHGGSDRAKVKKTARIELVCTPAQKEAIARAADKKGQTLTRFILEKCGVASLRAHSRTRGK
jgi:uncharacterized protein (DUF1778 family)